MRGSGFKAAFEPADIRTFKTGVVIATYVPVRE